VTADVSAGRLYAEVASDTSGFARDLRAKLDAEVKNLRAKIKVELDQRGLVTQARAAAKAASAAATVKLKVELDTRGIITQAKAAAAAASAAATVKLKAELDTREVAAAAKAASAAASAAGGGIKLPVSADTSKVDEEVDKVREKVKRTPPVNVPFSFDAKKLKELGTAVTGLSRLPAIAGGIYLLGTAAVQAGGGLFAMAAAASQAVGVLGALPNIVGIAAQGIGSLVIGIAGVPGALQAMAKAEKASNVATEAGGATAKATARAVESAARARTRAAQSVADAQRSLADAQRNADDQAQAGARAVRDAQRAVADAREQAAERSRAAIERVSDAEWSLARAQESARDAQLNLTKARADAKERIDDLNRALKGSALDEEAAMLAVEQARQNLQDANWNPMTSDLQKKQADLAYRQAIQNLADVKDSADDLRKETEKANKDGVDGSDAVQQAQDQVRDTTHAQQEAVENLAEAQRSAAKDQIASARAIADAQENLGLTIQANARASEQSARAIEQAQRGIADSQQNLADAELALADAQDTAKAGSSAAKTAADQAKAALDALSPAARKFALFLFGLKPQWTELRDAVAGALLPPLQRGIQSALPLLDTLQTGLVGSATVVGGFAEKLGRLFGTALFRKDVGTIMASNNRAMSDFGDAGLNLVKIMEDLGVTAGPLVERFAKWISTLTKGWQETVRAKRETGELGTFFQKAGDMAALLGKILGNLGRAIFNIGKAAAPTGKELLTTLSGVVEKWAQWTGSDAGQARMQQFFQSIKPATEELGRLVTNLVQFITATGENGGGALTGFLKTLNGILSALNFIMGIPGVGPALGALLTIAGSAGALGLVAGQILKIGASMQKIGKVTGLKKLFDSFGDGDTKAGKFAATLRSKVAGAVSTTGGAIGRAASAVGTFTANQVKAGLETVKTTGKLVFQTVATKAASIATRVWAITTTALGVAFRFATGPIGIIIGIIALLVGAIIYAYKNHEGFRNLVNNVWAKIQEVISYAWNSIIKPALAGLVVAAKAVGDAMAWLWEKAIKPAIGFIQAAFSLWWNYYAKPILTALVWAIKGVGAIVKWLWEKAISPYLSSIGSAFKTTWEKVIKPAWDALTGAVKWGWEKIISPAFEALKTGVGKLGGAFDTARDLVKTAWDKIQGVVKNPIRGVLDLVNNWVIDKFNFVSGKLGGPTIDRIDLKGFKDGGDIPGKRRGAKADNVVIRATPDEFMVRRWAADKLRKMAPGALEYINKFGALPGFANGGFIRGAKALAGYANGGFIRPVSAPWAGTWGHYASGGNHPALDFPTPVGTPVSAVMDGVVNAVKTLTGSYGKHIRISHANGIESIYGHLSDMIVQVGQKVSAGQLIGASGNTGNSTGPHLHLELRRGGVPFNFTDMLTSGKAPATGGKNALQKLLGKAGGVLGGIVGNPLDWFKEQINKPVQDLKDKFGNTAMAQMVVGMPSKMIESAADKVKSLIGLSGDASDPGTAGTNSNQSNRDIVRAQAAARGWTGAQWQALEWLVTHESGFNNLAQNPTSTARGLFQFLDSTWASVGGTKTDDPVLQTKYGLKYIAQRYGDPIGAKSFWQAHNWYDSGGWMLPGTGMHTNATGQPEAVLTNPQWRTVEQILGRLAAVSRSVRTTDNAAAAAAALVEHLEVNVQDKRDLPDALGEVDFRLRKILQGGVHASRTAGASARNS
jgi:hypothetical protein